MIESAIINKLSAESEITSRIGTYNGAPSIFSNDAPENAVFPYLIVRIDAGEPEGPVIPYNCYIDVLDWWESRVSAREVSFWIVKALDEQVLTHERYIDIRSWLFSGPTNLEDENDPRTIQINTQFYIRCARSKWMINAK